MAILDDNKKLDVILELFYNRFNAINTKTLQLMGQMVAKFNGLTSIQIHQLERQLELGNDLSNLIGEISKASKLSEKDVYKLLEQTAKENVEFSKIFYKAKNKEFVDYKKNKELQKIVNQIAKETNNLFKNISNTKAIGFVIKNNKGENVFKDLPSTFYDILDEAVYNALSSQTDYQSAMRNVLKQLADSGIRIHEEKVGYPSGYNRRIDSTVKQNILTGLRKINIGIQEQVGKEFGANGVEISAHGTCAEDHLYIQGKQYSKKQFEKLNNSLTRPIGDLNCRHFVFSIILGASQPNYTQKQLKQLEKDSTEKIEYEGKTYTKYEATQIQRQIETAIRKQKDRQIIAKASGDMEEVEKAQMKIRQYTEKYKDFSNKAGLDLYMNRTSVSGYKRVAIKK